MTGQAPAAPHPGDFRMTDFAVARKKMIENQLRTSGITDRRLLSVMAQIPRELFVPDDRKELAYIDEAHRLRTSGPARYLASAAPFARLVQLAEVNTDDHVLDVGCGTGYSAAVLGSLAARVTAIEPDAALAAAARANLASLGIDNITVIEAPLEEGARAHAPFDVILIEGAVAEVPQALFAQLADEEGRLVALIDCGGHLGVAHLYGRVGRDVAGRAVFDTNIPDLPTPAGPTAFVF